MAGIHSRSRIEVKITLSLNEEEARALEALAGYGHKDFVERFYEKFGRHYMEGHEEGLMSFLKSVTEIMPRELKKIDKAREAFK